MRLSSLVSCMALLALVLIGCQGGSDAVSEGRKAARMGEYDKALVHFDEAIKADPNDYNALWGKADIYQRQGNLLEQQALLEKLNTPEFKEWGGVVRPALEENYRKQAEAIMGGNPDQAEILLRKALEVATSKSSGANQTLAELLERRGDSALGKGEFQKAAEAFEQATKLRISAKMRSKLQGKGEIASFMAFKKSFEPKFKAAIGEPNDKGVHVVTERAIYDPKSKMFTLEAVHQIGRKEPKEDAEKEEAQKAALYEVTQALADLSWKLAGTERPEGAMVSYSREVVEIEQQGMGKDGRDFIYGYRIKVPEDAVIEQVQVIEKGEFKKPEPAAPEGAEGAAAPEGAEGAAAPEGAEGAAADEKGGE